MLSNQIFTEVFLFIHIYFVKRHPPSKYKNNICSVISRFGCKIDNQDIRETTDTENILTHETFKLDSK